MSGRPRLACAFAGSLGVSRGHIVLLMLTLQHFRLQERDLRLTHGVLDCTCGTWSERRGTSSRLKALLRDLRRGDGRHGTSSSFLALPVTKVTFGRPAVAIAMATSLLAVAVVLRRTVLAECPRRRDGAHELRQQEASERKTFAPSPTLL